MVDGVCIERAEFKKTEVINPAFLIRAFRVLIDARKVMFRLQDYWISLYFLIILAGYYNLDLRYVSSNYYTREYNNNTDVYIQLSYYSRLGK